MVFQVIIHFLRVHDNFSFLHCLFSAEFTDKMILDQTDKVNWAHHNSCLHGPLLVVKSWLFGMVEHQAELSECNPGSSLWMVWTGR